MQVILVDSCDEFKRKQTKASRVSKACLPRMTWIRERWGGENNAGECEGSKFGADCLSALADWSEMLDRSWALPKAVFQ